MSEYFGAPYAHNFTVGLSVAEALNLLQPLHGKDVQLENDKPENLKIMLEVTHSAENLAEFWMWTTRDIYRFAKLYTQIYGNIGLHGFCYRENYRTVISYDFYRHHRKPWHYRLFEDTAFRAYRLTGYFRLERKVVFEYIMLLIFIAMIAGMVFSGISLAVSIVLTLIFWGMASSILSYVFDNKPMQAVILLDGLICDIFRHHAPGIVQQQTAWKVKKNA